MSGFSVHGETSPCKRHAAPQVFSGRLKPNLQARTRTAGGRSSPVQISEQNLHLKVLGVQHVSAAVRINIQVFKVSGCLAPDLKTSLANPCGFSPSYAWISLQPLFDYHDSGLRLGVYSCGCLRSRQGPHSCGVV